jgi:hypothetical protein
LSYSPAKITIEIKDLSDGAVGLENEDVFLLLLLPLLLIQV